MTRTKSTAAMAFLALLACAPGAVHAQAPASAQPPPSGQAPPPAAGHALPRASASLDTDPRQQPAGQLPLPPEARRETEYRGAMALGLTLRRLGTTGRILMVGAHPDDENNPLLAYLGLGEGAEVGYMSLTRGEGGQDAIGPDFQEALGIIRSEELLAARRLDAAAQFFGRAYDFGFSKTGAEALQHWPRDTLLADVVRVIRMYRPDVLISVFTGTPRDGHGQHQAAGIVTKEAFEAAADPNRFPEQIRTGLQPWAPKKLYEGAYLRLDSATVRFPTGEMDPLLGLSYAEAASIARGRHRSQDQGSALPLGPREGGLRLVVDRTRGAPTGPHPERGIFEGIDTTLAQRAASALGPAAPAVKLFQAYDSAVALARAAFDPLRTDALVPLLAAARQKLLAAEAALPDTPAGRALAWYTGEVLDAETALADAEGVVFDAVADREQVVPGDTVGVTLTVWNGGRRPMELITLVPVTADSWNALPLDAQADAPVAPGTLVTRRFRVVVPPDAVPTQPYFLRLPRQGDLYTWPPDDPYDGFPFQPPPIRAAGAALIDGATVRFAGPVTFRLVSGRDGEIRRPVRIVPEVSVATDPAVTVRPLAAQHPLALQVRIAAYEPRGVAGVLRLTLPPGWRANPAEVPLQLAGDEARTLRFDLVPPAGLRPGAYPVAAAFQDAAGRRFTYGFRLVDYPHIRPHPLYRTATTRVQAVDVAVPRGLRVGYITGAGDEVPAALAQIGVQVTPLPPGSLAAADFSRFDDVVVGIRAYEVRPDLAAANPRLLQWVRDGGTLIVQYQQSGWTQFAPLPLVVPGHGPTPGIRVTDETAPVTLVDPASPVVTRPNRIGASDWEGWVQERGVFFAQSWDPHWQPVLSMADPGESPQKGSLLVAHYGKGVAVYTGLSLFRELPAGVPGAYRLFANLLALRGAAR